MVRHRRRGVERSDLVAADDGDVHASIVRPFAARTGPPDQAAGVMERLRLSAWRVREVRMGRAQVSCELVQRVASDEDADRHIEDAVLGVELLDGGAAGSVRSPCPKIERSA